MENTQTVPSLAEKVIPQATSKDVQKHTPEEVKTFADAIHQRVNADPQVKALTKNKNWVTVRQDNDRIVANICGPLRKQKTETGDKTTPLFSITVPLFSAQHLGPMLPYAGHSNHWANVDFLKRLHAVTGALLKEMEPYEKKTSK